MSTNKVDNMEIFDDLNAESDEDRMDTRSTIYVHNLPEELKENGIRDMFRQYGEVIDMYHPRDATWAYITYGTYHEAERAIRDLYNNKSLCVKAAFAKRSSNKKIQNSSISRDLGEKILVTDDAKPLSAYTADVKYRQGAGRGQRMNAIHKYSTIPQIGMLHADSEPLPSCSHSQASNMYEAEDNFENTSRLWTRDVMTISADGKKHVAGGRGYTLFPCLYEYPEENPKIKECLKKLYEKRLKGSYECGEDKVKDRLQICYTCSTETTKHCAKCFTYYCSRLCQVKDWPRHQKECERIPDLIEETIQNISTLRISKEEQEKRTSKQRTPNAINKTIASNDIKLRRPNTPQNLSNTQSNGTNVSKTERVDQSVNNAVTKDSFQQNQRPKYTSIAGNTDQSKEDEGYQRPRYNTAGNTDQSKGNEGYQRPKYNSTAGNIDQSKEDEGYSIKANSNRQNYNRSQNNATNRTSYNKDRVDNTNVRDRSYNTGEKNQSDQKYGFQNNKKFSPYNGGQNDNKQRSSASSNSNTDDDLAFNKDTYLSNKEFTEIEIVVSLSNNEYWIVKVKDIEARKNLMVKLQDVALKSRNITPIIGNIYGVLFEDIWHRAMVASLNPITVHYIDFGNDEILAEGAVIKDIEDMSKVPRFAKKIQLTPAATKKYKNLQYGDIISVRMLSMNTDGTIIVEVKGQLEDSSVPTKEGASQSDTNNAMEKTMSQEEFKMPPIISIKASKIKVTSVLDAFANLLTEKAVIESEFKGFIEIVESTQMNVYNASLCPNIYGEEIAMLLQDLQEECAKMEKSMNCGSNGKNNGQIEDLVCGKDEERGWYRGYVLTSSDLRIITVDDAKIVSVDQILPCPEKFLNILAFGVVCTVNHPTITLEMGQVYEFSTTMNQQSCKQGSLKIDITVKEKVITAVIKSWESLITKSIPALAELKSGSKICLTSYRNQYVMYARSLNESEVEYYNDILQRVAQCARSAPNLSESPNKGQIVIAPFCDGNYYRAMVMDVKDDKAKIAYIDFGNIDYISIKELKVLSEDLARQRSCSAKVVLKDVSRDVPMTVETDRYLRNLTGQEVPLKCVYEGSPSKDGVYLTMRTGEKVNDELNKLLVPSWKQQEDDKNRYMLYDIKTASLGRVGDTVKAWVTYVQEAGKQYMLSPCDKDAWIHHDNVMVPMMKEFCEKTEYYIPRRNELCFALYAGTWYRAACLNPQETDTMSQIFFIDYGNIELVKHQDIRRMPSDFITPAALANLCTVVNLAPFYNADNYPPAVRQKIEELTAFPSPVEIKILNCDDSGEYEVEFSDIYAKLVAENLIKSAEKF